MRSRTDFFSSAKCPDQQWRPLTILAMWGRGAVDGAQVWSRAEIQNSVGGSGYLSKQNVNTASTLLFINRRVPVG